MTVAKILENHPELELIPVKDELASATADGIDFDGAHPEMKLARRFYPHVSDGEGQFVAVMKKAENSTDKQTILYKDSSISPSKSEIQIVEKFLKDNFNTIPNGRLIKQGDFISIIPHDCPIPQRSVFMPGIVVGEIQKNLLKPHHQLFSAYGADMKNRIYLKKGDARIEKYLRGEEIDWDTAESGWCAVCYEGVPLGGGKISGGRVKNHYPKGLRNK
jgi:NOL1/NOP2/fmu family ribosome biogenesis protein